MHFAAVGGTLPHNMIFAPYGAKLDIILKTSSENYFQKRVDEIKGLKTKQIHAYIELIGVDIGRGPFLFLPRGIEMKKELLGYVKRYFAEYKKDLINHKIHLEGINKALMNESVFNFQEQIKKVNKELFTRLEGEFKAMKRFLRLYFMNSKLAWCFYKIRYFPLIVSKECKRAMKKLALLKEKFKIMIKQ